MFATNFISDPPNSGLSGSILAFVLRQTGLVVSGGQVDEITPSSSFTFKDALQRFAKLSTFRYLEEGWDGTDSAPPNEAAISTAQTVLLEIYSTDLMPLDICPSVEGGVSIYFEKGDKYADIEFFNNGEIIAGLANRIDSPRVLETNLNNIHLTLNQIRHFLND